MRRPLNVLLHLGLLAALGVGCAQVGDRVDSLRGTADDLRDSAEQVVDAAGFCLALARAASGIESGSPDTAGEAAEEALARAPEDLAPEARAVTEALREARDAGDLSDPELQASVRELASAASERCAAV